MKVCVLSSGSKGNTTYVESAEAKILLDCGNSSKYICDCLEQINVNPKEIDAILITHVHSDHIKGLQVLLKKINPTVYITEKMHPYLDFINNYKYITTNKLEIKDIEIEVLKTSHDADDSVGYIVKSDNKSIVYLTDTGYINKRYYNILSNRNIYIFESNHDVELLNNGRYPFELRQRILSDKGHLSNYDSASYLSKFIGEDTEEVILAHLSEENNTPELALKTLKDRLSKEDIKFNNIIIAKQNERTELITV